jgi:hypothetical protein
MACRPTEQDGKMGRCLAEESCHLYQSNGNSSRNTRTIAKVATARSVAERGRKGRVQRTRENRKRAKIRALEEVELEDWEEEIKAVMLLGRKVYIGGISERLLPTNLPFRSIRWSVHTHLIPYLNERGDGCRATNSYTLLPREWITECFPKTDQYFQLFMRMLGLHPGLMPRGENKVPIYDRGTPETYVIVGTSAKRFGRGLRLVDRKLKREELRNDRCLLKKFFRQVAHAATAYLDTPSIRYLNVVKEMTSFSKFSFDDTDESLIWPSLAVAANVVMEMHTDQDFVMGCAGVLGGRGYREHDASGGDILQYFCFPSIGSAVGLRNGDLLLFNPTIPHCVSSRATMTEDVICTSFYLKTAIVGGNDNALVVPTGGNHNT